MSDNSKIEWTDTTWNPVAGCTKVSAGCDRCYAEGIATRFAGTKAFPRGFAVTLHPERLTQPLRWRKPRFVFVNSMSDLFHADIPDDYIAQVFAVMALAEDHIFQVLTKRHGRMRSLLSSSAFLDAVQRYGPQIAEQHGINGTWAGRITDPRLGPLRNVWLGVSVEDQRWADIRIPALLDTPAAVRFLSCEPLLGPVDLRQAVAPMGSQRGHGATASWVHAGCCDRRFHGIDWVIVGGESGPRARRIDLDWAQSLVNQCQAADVAVFVKQLGSRWGKDHHNIDQFPAGLRVREYPTSTAAVAS